MKKITVQNITAKMYRNMFCFRKYEGQKKTIAAGAPIIEKRHIFFMINSELQLKLNKKLCYNNAGILNYKL